MLSGGGRCCDLVWGEGGVVQWEGGVVQGGGRCFPEGRGREVL